MSVQRAWPADVYVREIPPFAQRLYAQVTKCTSLATVHVAGSMSFDEHNQFVGEGDLVTQTRQVLEVIRRSLTAVGAVPTDVIKTTSYVVDVNEYVRVGHPEWLHFFGEHLPASTTVEVSRLVEPRALIEIEAHAGIEG